MSHKCSWEIGVWNVRVQNWAVVLNYVSSELPTKMIRKSRIGRIVGGKDVAVVGKNVRGAPRITVVRNDKKQIEHSLDNLTLMVHQT